LLRLQQENARLQQENARLQQEREALRRQVGNVADIPAAVETSGEASGAAGGQSATALGDTTVELGEVVVTRRRALEQVRNEAQSVSVVSGEDLKRNDAVTLEAIAKRLSNVKWNYGNSSTSNYSIRGLGKISNVDGGDPSVGIYVDGVAYAFNQMAYFNFIDVDTVQVAHGPQGTQFGKNSSIGSIRVYYKRPSFTPSSEVSLGFSKYEDQSYWKSNGSIKATAISTGPLVDGLLAYRAAVNVDKGGGWILNSYNPDNRYISSDRVSGRISLLLTPTPDFDANLTVEINPRNNENVNIGSTNYFFTQTPSHYANGAPYTSLTTEQRLGRGWFTRNADYTVIGNYFNQEFIASDSQQGLVTGSNGAKLELNKTIGKSLLTSVTAFRDYYFNAFRDDEGTVFDVQTAAGGNKVYRQYSQEFGFDSKIGDIADTHLGLFIMKAVSDSTSNNAYGTDGGAWFASNAQYGRLDVTGANGVAGRALLNDSLADLWRETPSRVDNLSVAFLANADWHVSEPLTVNTGLRFSREKRELTSSAVIVQQGYGAALNPEALGGFTASAGSSAITGNADAADYVAQRYYGLANWAALDATQRQQVIDAQAIRRGRTGTLFSPYKAKTYTGNLVTWNIAPRYRFNESVTGYFNIAHGEKSGLPGVLSGTGEPVSYTIKPEKNNALEIGAKTTWLGGALLLNAAVFRNDIKNYQQNVYFVDEAQSALEGETIYVSGAGNVPKVRAQGIEVDGVYSGLPYTTIRFSGAYNDARYKKFNLAAYPVERANEGTFHDISGETLPGASKWSFNIGATVNYPISGNALFRAGFDTSYQSRYNSDNSLSDYAWIPGYSTTDFTLGFGDKKGRWDVNFLVKNAFDDDTPRNKTWNAWAPGFPRQYAIIFTGRL
jgi:outer membrane receptor protein involved in Fe transport